MEYHLIWWLIQSLKNRLTQEWQLTPDWTRFSNKVNILVWLPTKTRSRCLHTALLPKQWCKTNGWLVRRAIIFLENYLLEMAKNQKRTHGSLMMMERSWPWKINIMEPGLLKIIKCCNSDGNQLTGSPTFWWLMEAAKVWFWNVQIQDGASWNPGR